jgi:hypothetical protein
MSLRLALLSALLGPVLAGAACNGSPSKSGAGDSAAQSATPPAPAPAPAAAPAGASADPDQAVAGNGVPAGFVGRTDEAGSPISGAKYTAAPNGTWEVRTGPAHILYSPSLVAHTNYTVTAKIDQLEAPRHPEAYGIFIGGQQLGGATASSRSRSAMATTLVRSCRSHPVRPSPRLTRQARPPTRCARPSPTGCGST